MWEQSFEEADALFVQGRHKEAADAARLAVEEAEKEFGSADRRVATALGS